MDEGNAKRKGEVYSYLCSLAMRRREDKVYDPVSVGLRRMQEEVGISQRNLVKCLEELEEMEAISIDPGTARISNAYWVRFGVEFPQETGSSRDDSRGGLYAGRVHS